MLPSVWSLCLVLIFHGVIGSTRRLGLLSDPVSRSVVRNKERASIDPTYSWNTAFFDVPINNFAYTNRDKFAMRYLYNNTYYKNGGPIFFYAGNEGSIVDFAENTGIMFDLAPRFDASILFAEHRYYGESKPFGNKSYSNVQQLGFLASTQALGDYAKLLKYFKSNVLNCAPDTPVIAFGGSYGGMLAAWFRMKYPHIVTGAWASSAPVLLFKGANVDPGAFAKVVTEDFVKAGCNRDAISRAWTAIHDLASTPDGLTTLNNMFVIDAKSKLTQASDADFLVVFIRAAFEYLSMINYPYPSGFLQPIPGWPIKEACKRAQAAFPQTPTTSRDLANYLYIIANLYYNYTGTVGTNCVIPKVCGDQATSAAGDEAFGWPWQSCTELVIEMCARGGGNDFFFDECQQAGGVLNLVTDYCLMTFSGIGYNKNFLFELNAPIQYGLEFSAASNIIFTNGDLDPWSVGGVFANTPGVQQASKNGVYTYFIEGSAHHLDLRQPNTCDPAPVKNARFQIVNIIDCWVHPKKCSSLPTMKPLPPLDSPSAINCEPVVNGYPWGQQ